MAVVNPALWVPGLFSILVAILSYFVSRRKTRAEASQITVATALDLLEPLRNQVKDLNDRVRLLEKKLAADEVLIRYLEDGVAELTRQIVDLNHEPRWRRN